MFRVKSGFLVLIVAALLCWQVMPAGVDTAISGIYECTSTVSGAGGCYLVCPAGDGSRFDDNGAVISVTVRYLDEGIPGIPASDIWLYGCGGETVLCGGSRAIDADSATSAFPPVGYTTISGAMAAGGCDAGLIVIVQGILIGCPEPTCLSYSVKSPDIDGDLAVNIVDLALFAAVYVDQPAQYDVCYDYDCDGTIGIVDLAIFAQHFQHWC